jgi:hypothetical protein
LFIRARSWQDSTGTGIPNWWWLQYFGQTTNVNAYVSAAGDGYSNLQKYQMGLNPTNYYNPNPITLFFGYVAASTNIYLAWTPATNIGPATFIINRGIYNTNTSSYTYSQIGVLNSNATYFEDVGALNNSNAWNNVYQTVVTYGGNAASTNTWQVNWYANYASYGPPYGPPLPGNVYAYADVTGTNVLLSWTSAGSLATNYIVLRGVFTNFSYINQQLAQVSTNTFSYEVYGALTNQDNWGNEYLVEGVYPGGGLSYAASSYIDYPEYETIAVGSNNTTNTPTNFYGYPDASGTNIFLTWSPVSGATNYIIYGGFYDDDVYVNVHAVLGKVGAGTNMFEVVGAVDGSGNNLYDLYDVVAVYPGGILSSNAEWSSYGGAPSPGALSAYLDSTGTNVLLVWTAPSGVTPTGYLIQKSDYYGESWSYYELAQTNSSTFSYKDIDGVDSGYYGIDSIEYEVQAIYPSSGLSQPVTATIATNPPAPSNLSGTVDSTGTNVFLSWSPAVGTVSDYIILRGTYNQSTGQYTYSQIATVSSSATSYTDTGAITSRSSDNDVYEVEADYGNGDISAPDISNLSLASSQTGSSVSITAQLVRNETGRWQLIFSGISTNVQTIALTFDIREYWYDLGDFPDTSLYPFSVETDIPVSSLTNGAYVIPDFLITSALINGFYYNNGGGWDGVDGPVVMVQPIKTDGTYGNQFDAGALTEDEPAFADGRLCMKQNLLYKLRAATVSQPNAGLTEYFLNTSAYGVPSDTNYVESSFFHYTIADKGYNSGYATYIGMDDIWPFNVNYQLHQSLYDPSHSEPSSFTWQGSLTTTPTNAVLGIGDPYWISQGLGNLAEVAAYESGNSLYLQSGSHNLFGIPFAAALVNEGGVDYNYYPFQTYPPITLSPGGSVTLSNSDSFFNPNVFFSQTADPSLVLTNYYFAPVNTPGTFLSGESTPVEFYPLPCDLGFANTNQTGVLVTSVGTPTVIGGWAKFSISNGSSSKFAYLGQYFQTNAFLFNASGSITTNKTGVTSPYGNFFPTQPGVVAMTTMPDIDTGAQGTGVVRVVSINVDANHDGTMDFTYGGPDFVSQSKPLRFWVNDSSDDNDFGGDGIPTQGSQGNGVRSVAGQWQIHGRRDLVNYFPVYLNIGSLFQSNALSAGISFTDTNWQFVLSQGDGVLRFAYTDLTPTNYMNFLRDTNESGNLASAALTTITNVVNGGISLPQSFIAGIATNNEGIILVEAAAPTTQPLMLTLYHGSNQIAQVQLPLSIAGVEQMFRYKNLLLNSDTRAQADRLTDADVPNEPDTIDKNVVFVHGYSVNPYQARGWFADIYKRLYWTGSHAKFYGVVWDGYDSQGAFAYIGLPNVTPNYQTNVFHAFQTAPLLGNFIATLNSNAPTVVLAHSLGNMVSLSALSDYSAPINQYFMLDAAVPMEAIDGSTPINTNMVFSTTPYLWLAYSNYLWASKWFTLWPTNDARSTLTWSNRLANFGDAAVYNFYSSGEDVLRTYVGPPPGNLFTLFGAQLVQYIEGQSGTYVWTWQEKDKGRMSGNSILSSDHGGWGFFGISSIYTTYTVAMANAIPPSQLQTNAFFDMSVDTAMFTTSSSGSDYARTNRNRILSDAIPALTLPIGANSVSRLTASDRNFDMQEDENGWPVGRGGALYPLGTTAFGEWHHSDIRVVAYPFTYKVFNEIVNDGNLK